MTNLNSLNFEVHYKYRGNDKTRVLAAFHFKFEAEKYIEVFHPIDKERYFIVEKNA